MCKLKKTEYSINEMVILVLIPNESYHTIKHIFIKLYYIVYRDFVYGHGHVSFSFYMHICIQLWNTCFVRIKLICSSLFIMD